MKCYIAYRNPRTYSICAAILSKLLCFVEIESEKQKIIEKIKKKFSQIPNTGHMQIWLQRVTIPFARDVNYDEPMCKLISGEEVRLWNIDWISSPTLISALNASKAINKCVLENLEPVILAKEVELFITKATDGYS